MITAKECTRSCGVDLLCKLTTTRIDDGELMGYTTYGVEVVDKEGNLLFSYPDIAPDQEFVERFVQLCVENTVADVHFIDVLEDYLP